MSIPRLYVPRALATGDILAAAREQARYLKTVLRMGAGDPLVVFNGTNWEYDAVIHECPSPESVALEIVGKRPAPISEIEIKL